MQVQSNLFTTATLETLKKWPLYIVYGGFSIKIGIKISLARLRMGVVGRWPFFNGGRKHRFGCDNCLNKL